MKKRFSKLTALLLSMVMMLSLVLPALAFEDTDPPQWEQLGFSSLEELLTDWELTEDEYYEWLAQPAIEAEQLAAQMEEKRQAWIAAHPEEAAAFDPYAYFEEEYYYYDDLEEYMVLWELTQEEFEQEMLADWVSDQIYKEEWQKRFDDFAAAHPEKVAAFDPYAYFEEKYYYYDEPEMYMAFWGLTREKFEQEMLESWLSDQLAAEELEKEIAQFKADYPEECAAFDPYAYFLENYPFFSDPQEYMEWMGQTEEEFCQDMFLEWMFDFQAMAEAKEQAGGSVRGINVMVDGQCIPFPDVRPEAKNGRTMVPLRSAMEHLGAQVDYDPETRTAQVSMDGLSFTHVIGTDTLKLSDGSAVKMDVASYAKDGRTMVPVRFFAQVLGYEVLWDGDYQTAVLLDRQGLIDGIDQDFTLFNRVLYAASGSDQVKEGQVLEQSVRFDLDLTLFDTLHGDKKIPAGLSASALANDKAIEMHLSGDLSGLIDYLESVDYLLLDDEEIAQLRAALSNFSVDVIVNLEVGAVYLHSPILAILEPDLEDPDAWFAFPMDLSALEELDLSLSSLSQSGTVGQIVLDTDMNSPFWLYDSAVSDAKELGSYVGDSRFTKSGNSYVMSFQDAGYGWDTGKYNYTIKATVTPSGEKSCTYSVTFDLTSDEMAANASLKGSSGKADLALSFHLKNTFKFTLEGTSRTSGSNKAPLSEPPKGSKVEFPLGSIGSGSL